MIYELPLARLFYQDPDDASDPVVPYYTAAQMQAAYQAGRESMREEAAKVCEEHQATCGECPETAQYCADKIRSIKI